MTRLKLVSDLAFIIAMVAGPCLGAMWGRSKKMRWGIAAISVIAINCVVQVICLVAILKA